MFDRASYRLAEFGGKLKCSDRFVRIIHNEVGGKAGLTTRLRYGLFEIHWVF